VAGLSNPSRYRESGCVERRSHRRARYGIVEHAGRTVDARAQLTVEIVVEERPGAEDQRIHRRGDGQQPRRLPRHKANYKSSLYEAATAEPIKGSAVDCSFPDFLGNATAHRLEWNAPGLSEYRICIEVWPWIRPISSASTI